MEWGMKGGEWRGSPLGGEEEGVRGRLHSEIPPFPGLINPKFATRGCATESACYAKAGAQVPSASYIYFLRRADCLPAPQPPGRVE